MMLVQNVVQCRSSIAAVFVTFWGIATEMNPNSAQRSRNWVGLTWKTRSSAVFIDLEPRRPSNRSKRRRFSLSTCKQSRDESFTKCTRTLKWLVRALVWLFEVFLIDFELNPFRRSIRNGFGQPTKKRHEFMRIHRILVVTTTSKTQILTPIERREHLRSESDHF